MQSEKDACTCPPCAVPDDQCDHHICHGCGCGEQIVCPDYEPELETDVPPVSDPCPRCGQEFRAESAFEEVYQFLAAIHQGADYNDQDVQNVLDKYAPPVLGRAG